MRKFKKNIVIFTLVMAVSISSLGCIPPSMGSVPSITPDENTAVTHDQQNNARLKVGDRAPEFGLQDINGNYVALSDFVHEKVVINMWWLSCHGCADEMPQLQAFYEDWKQLGLVLMAINVYDTVDLIRAFAESKGLTFILLVDVEKKLNIAYVHAGVPTTFFIDGEGIIQAIKDGAFENTAEIENIYNSY